MGSIILNGVQVEFDGQRVLTVDQLELTQKTIAVIGANGSGKSTFARLLNGLVKPSQGTVVVNNVDVAQDQRAAVRQAGFIFANPDVQIVMPTVIEDVEFSLRDSKLSRADRRERALEVIGSVGLAGLAEAPAQSLSSGQKQLLAIAAITVKQPSLIIADEPTALLDAGNTRAIASLLLAPAANQVVLVTHDLNLAQMCEVAVHFEGGQLANLGDPQQVVGQYARQFA